MGDMIGDPASRSSVRVAGMDAHVAVDARVDVTVGDVMVTPASSVCVSHDMMLLMMWR